MADTDPAGPAVSNKRSDKKASAPNQDGLATDLKLEIPETSSKTALTTPDDSKDKKKDKGKKGKKEIASPKTDPPVEEKEEVKEEPAPTAKGKRGKIKEEAPKEPAEKSKKGVKEQPEEDGKQSRKPKRGGKGKAEQRAESDEQLVITSSAVSEASQPATTEEFKPELEREKSKDTKTGETAQDALSIKKEQSRSKEGSKTPKSLKADSKKPEDKAATKSVEKSVEKSTEKSVEKVGDKRSEKSVEKVADKQSEKSVEKQVEKRADKSAERQVDKRSEKSVDRQSEKQADKSVERQLEKRADKSAERQSEKRADKSVERLPDKRVEKSVEIQAEKSETEPVGEGEPLMATESQLSVLKRLRETGDRARAAGVEVDQLRREIAIFAKKPYASKEDINLIKAKQALLMQKMDEFVQITKDMENMMGLKAVSSRQLGPPGQVKFRRINEADLPKVIVCKTGNQEIPQIVICEPASKGFRVDNTSQSKKQR
ncbi:cilia- and flagella-associated protein 251-like [Cimex lectularius]|uniref:Uncharacterized protein n=1 Tax=Cimex lectularius TaxID=79782 RepID=A0A8I6RWV3_CIMLE|nr:cilia- and flagella-associated protein 251-like [Cimex lectularius]